MVVSPFTSKDECSAVFVVLVAGQWRLLCEARPILDLQARPQTVLDWQY